MSQFQVHLDRIATSLLSEIGEIERSSRNKGKKSHSYGLVIRDGQVHITEICDTEIPKANTSENDPLTLISSDDAMALYAEDGRVFRRILDDFEFKYRTLPT